MKIADFISRLDSVTPSGNGYTARCPAHHDKNNSLSIGNGDGARILVNCFTGCRPKAIVAALGLNLKDLFESQVLSARRGACESVKCASKSPKNKNSRCETDDVKAGEPCEGLTLSDLAAAKKLPEAFLASLGLRDTRLRDRNAVRLPYLTEDGSESDIRYRLALTGDARFRWRTGAKASLYGLQRLADVHRAGSVLLVEGEDSDCWTACTRRPVPWPARQEELEKRLGLATLKASMFLSGRSQKPRTSASASARTYRTRE